MRETPLSVNERTFIQEALKSGVRVDGRRVDEQRPISFLFHREPGTVEVSLGQTRALAVMSCKVVPPFPDRPAEGFFQVTIEASPMAGPEFSAGRPNDMAAELGRLLERNLRETRAVDTEGLCIIAGVKVFSVQLVVHLLDNNGNLADCAQLAATAALLSFRRPDVTVKGDEVRVHSVIERTAVPLGVLHTPVSVSFAIFGNGERCVLDPLLKEELASDGLLTISVNNFKEICGLHKPGGAPIAFDLLMQCVLLAKARAEAALEALHAAIAAQEKEQRVTAAPGLRITAADAPKPAPVPVRHLPVSTSDVRMDQQEEQARLQRVREGRATAQAAAVAAESDEEVGASEEDSVAPDSPGPRRAAAAESSSSAAESESLSEGEGAVVRSEFT